MRMPDHTEQTLPIRGAALIVFHRHSGKAQQDTWFAKIWEDYAAANGIDHVLQVHTTNKQLGAISITMINSKFGMINDWVHEIVRKGFAGPIYFMVPSACSYLRNLQDWRLTANALPKLGVTMVSVRASDGIWVRVRDLQDADISVPLSQGLLERSILAAKHHERMIEKLRKANYIVQTQVFHIL
jgi:hypothetical protein